MDIILQIILGLLIVFFIVFFIGLSFHVIEYNLFFIFNRRAYKEYFKVNDDVKIIAYQTVTLEL